MKKILTVLAACVLSLTHVWAQDASYRLHKYNSNDGGILTNITPNGEWSVINLGTTASGGNATSKLYKVDTEEVIPVTYSGREVHASAVSNDGNIVVGSFSGRPVALNRATNKLTVFPLRNLWQSGSLTAVTPDGKWAVGSYNGYNGKLSDNDDLSHDYYYSPLLVNLETGDTIATPGLPRLDMSHLDQHAMRFTDITPDGRYVVGEMSWYIMQPVAGFVFVYDTQDHTYRVVGFTEDDRRPWTPAIADLHHLEYPTLSPDGHWMTGMGYVAKAQEGSDFFREYGAPFRYDMQTGKFELLEVDDANVDGCVITNNGTIFANPNTGSPLRDFRILFQDKYWITMNQICRQAYGFSFPERSGYERSGTVTSVCGDGSRFISFPDPMGESYCFDFGRPVEEVCANIDLLENYSVLPAAGSVFSQISTIEVNFGRAIQVLGTGKNVHLYKADGTKVADGLTAGNQGLSLKTGSKSTVNAVFRTRALEDGVDYFVVIDAGAVAVSTDAERVNKEIRIAYKGRRNGPVQMTKVSPENHAQLRQIDAASSYVLVSFDCPVKLTENASASLIRVEDGNRMATLTLNEGNTEATRNQVLLYPVSTVYLYDGMEYKVVIDSASVCDYAGSVVSYNQPIEISYHGTYIREVGSDAVLFSDDFNDPAASYANWLRFEGDHHKPLSSMEAWGFDTDNMPWSFGMSDDATYADCFAGSHSLYAPSAQSDDWMMTPQLLLPGDGKTVLEFDAQSYNPSKADVLKVYVFEEDFEISYLNEAWMEDVRLKSVLLDSITLSAGANQETTAGEWTRYRYDLSAWAGKNIYLAFVNQNYNQSAVFVDNVSVQRELLYTIGFANAGRVVGKNEIQLNGQFTVKTDQPVSSISLVLKDADGKEVSRTGWPSVSGNIKDRPIPFAFPQTLPLTIGRQNDYTIDVQLDELQDVYKGSILDLSFEPVKRVVLEEMTGVDCPNCPLGILSIEKCEKAFGEQFIPVSIHTYTGDPWMGNLEAYSQFLGLNAAPSARINRTAGTYYPFVSVGGEYKDTYPESPLWYDIVAQELSRLAPCDINLTAVQSENGKNIDFSTSLRYAVNADNQQLSLFVIVMENGLEYYQANNLGSLEMDILGPWGAGGINSGAYAYPVTHNDVVRSVIGQTFSGTIGLFPATVEADKTYTSNFSASFPQAIEKVENATAVAMLIDSQSGEVVNACRTRVLGHQEYLDGIGLVEADLDEAPAYTLSGVRVAQPARKGIYIMGGRKVVVK